MAKLSILAGATSQSVNILILDSTSTTGAGLTGLVFNSGSLIAYYTFTGANAGATAITLATLATVGAAWSSGGFKQIDSTHMPGLYRFDLPDAVLAAASGRVVTVILRGAANMVDCRLEIELTGTDNQDGTRGGMTALPNAAAAASGGLLVNGSNTGTVTLAALTITGAVTFSTTLTVTGATVFTGNVSMAAGLNITQSGSNTSALVVTGNGTGHGAIFTSGSGATGNGVQCAASSTNGVGLNVAGHGSGAGLAATGGATGPGMAWTGGGTSGDGLIVTTTIGHGFNVAATGTSKHGATFTGGTAGTSDGFKVVAGSGGVGLRSDLLTTAMAESYAADGAAATLTQLLYQIYSAIVEVSISGTALSMKKLDGSTVWGICTLDDATTPTSRSRTS